MQFLMMSTNVMVKRVHKFYNCPGWANFFNMWWLTPPPLPPPKKEILVRKWKCQTKKGSLIKKHKKILLNVRKDFFFQGTMESQPVYCKSLLALHESKWCIFGARAIKVSQKIHFYCFHNVQEVKEMSNHLKEATMILPWDCNLG